MRVAIAPVALLALMALAAPTFAQSGGLFGSQRPTNPNLGQGSSLGSFGGGGAGGMTGGLPGTAAPVTNPLTNIVTDPLGSSVATGGGFVGRSNTGFVGNRMASQQGGAMAGGGAGGAAGAGLGRGGAGGQFGQQLGGLQGLQGLQSQLGRQQQQRGLQQQRGFAGANGMGAFGQAGFGGRGMTTQPAAVQIRQRVAFTPPTAAVTRAQVGLEARMQRMASTRPEFQTLQFDVVEGRTIVLRGTVDTPEQARFAETVARLEPGVDRVVNELVVNGQ